MMPFGAGPAQQLGYLGTQSGVVDHTWEGVDVPAEPCVGERRAQPDLASGTFPSPESREAASSQEPRGRCSPNEWSRHSGSRMAAVARTKAHPVIHTLTHLLNKCLLSTYCV